MRVLICLSIILCWWCNTACSKERDPFDYSQELLTEKNLNSDISYLYIPEPASPQIKVKGVMSFDNKVMVFAHVESLGDIILRQDQKVKGDWFSFTVKKITSDKLVIVFKNNKEICIQFRK